MSPILLAGKAESHFSADSQLPGESTHKTFQQQAFVTIETVSMDGEIPWHIALLQNAKAVLLRQTPVECPALVADVQHQGKVVPQGEQDLRTKGCSLDISVSKTPVCTGKTTETGRSFKVTLLSSPTHTPPQPPPPDFELSPPISSAY